MRETDGSDYTEKERQQITIGGNAIFMILQGFERWLVACNAIANAAGQLAANTEFDDNSHAEGAIDELCEGIKMIYRKAMAERDVKGMTKQ